jgi:hypothetical protein
MGTRLEIDGDFRKSRSFASLRMTFGVRWRGAPEVSS